MVNEALQLIELPPKPDWFDRELEAIETVNGKPLFRCRDGQRELAWRNGKWDVKYLLMSDNRPCYAKLPRYKFRRQNLKTREYVVYGTYEQAQADNAKGLSKLIERNVTYEVRAVGRPCWVIEIYNSPDEINYDAWQKLRYQWWENAAGIVQKVDVLGEYPSDGRYMFCVDVIDDEGNAVSPHRGVIEKLKMLKYEYENDKRTADQCVRDATEAQARFEKQAVYKAMDNFYQKEGLSARKMLHFTEISKPIAQKEKTNV